MIPYESYSRQRKADPTEQLFLWAPTAFPHSCCKSLQRSGSCCDIPIAHTCLEGGICSRIHIGGIGRSSRCIAHGEASWKKEHTTVIYCADFTLQVLIAHAFTEASKQSSITPAQIKHCNPLLPSSLKMNANWTARISQVHSLSYSSSAISIGQVTLKLVGKQHFV